MTATSTRRRYCIASIGDINYWAIPKCGNTSIKAFLLHRYSDVDATCLNPLESNHFVHQEGVGFTYLTPDEALTNGRRNVTFVRDPIKRFKSLYLDFCVRRSNPGLPGFFGMTVDACLAEVERQFARSEEMTINPHLRSQRYYLEHFRGNVFLIDQFMNLHINVTAGSLELTAEQIRRVGAIYHDDFRFLERTEPLEGLFS